MARISIQRKCMRTCELYKACPSEAHKMYVPEMVFGHLLTSDNYDDQEEKVTGGRNGYGAKLTNIFSTKFTIECGDAKRNLNYQQTWTNNMGIKQPPKITKYSGKDGLLGLC